MINDPHLDGSFDIEHGLHVGRELLVELAEMEIPLATEALDPISLSTLQIRSAGQPLVLVQLSRKRTVKWQAAFQCQSASKMVQTAT